MPLIGKSFNNIFVFLIMLFSELKQSHFRVTYVKSKWVDFLHCLAVVSPKRSRKSFLKEYRNVAIERLSITFTSNTNFCTTWPSFLFICRLLFIISTPKLVVSRIFFINKNCLELFLSGHFLFCEILNSNLMKFKLSKTSVVVLKHIMRRKNGSLPDNVQRSKAPYNNVHR